MLIKDHVKDFGPMLDDNIGQLDSLCAVDVPQLTDGARTSGSEALGRAASWRRRKEKPAG